MTLSRKEYLRRYRADNKARLAANRKIDIEKKRASDRAYAQSDKGKATRKRYADANREKLNAYARAYYYARKANPEADTGTPRTARPRPRPPARPEPDIRDQLRQEQAARQARINAKRAQYARRQPFAQQESH